MPSHWQFKFEKLRGRFSFVASALDLAIKLLCLISFGHVELADVWEVCTSDDQTWQEGTARVADRLNTIVVTAGLLLGATAAFITTEPPLPDKFNFNKGGAYICLLVSFAASLGTLVVGSSIVFIVSKCTRKWFEQTLMGSSSRIVCTMYLFAYPFLSMGVSTSVAAVGLLIAAFSSMDGLIVKGAIWLLFFPATCLPVWWWTQRDIVHSLTEGVHPPDEEYVPPTLSQRCPV